MIHPSVSEPLFARRALTQVCAYCGAHFRVLLTCAPEGNEPVDYFCPECGKQYDAEAALQPQVSLLRSRADGKKDRYQETMF